MIDLNMIRMINMTKYVVAKGNEVVPGIPVIPITPPYASQCADMLNGDKITGDSYAKIPATADMTSTVVCKQEDLIAAQPNYGFDGFPPCILVDSNNDRRIYKVENIPVGCKRYYNACTVTQAIGSADQYPRQTIVQDSWMRTDSTCSQLYAVVTNEEMRRVIGTQCKPVSIEGKVMKDKDKPVVQKAEVNYLKSDPVTVPMPVGWPPYLHRDEERELGVYKLSDIPIGCKRRTACYTITTALGSNMYWTSTENDHGQISSEYMAVVDDVDMVKALDARVGVVIKDADITGLSVKLKLEKLTGANVCQEKRGCPACPPPLPPADYYKKYSNDMADVMKLADSLPLPQKPYAANCYTDKMRAAWSLELRIKVKASEDKRKADSMVMVDRDFEDYE